MLIHQKLNTILYVEDEKSNQVCLSDFLCYFCNDLFIANNGVEALEIYKNKSIDLVISDINMPLMNGIELVTKIKELDEEQHIIFVTAFSDTNYLQDAIKLQVDAYVLKPVDLDILEKQILKVISSNVLNETQEVQKKELETILNTTKDGIAIIDTESNFLYVNTAFEKMLGYTKHELYDTSSISLGLKDDKERSLKNIQKVLEVGFSENFEKTYITKSGKPIDISLNLSLMPDKQRLLLAARDITEEKEAKRLVNAYLEKIDKNILTMRINISKDIETVTTAYCELSGYDKSDLINQKIYDFLNIEKSVLDSLDKIYDSGNIWVGEIKNQKKDGSSYWTLVHVSNRYDSRGKKTGYIIIMYDVTDKKRIEKISQIDPLTQLYNRRYLDDMFLKVVNSAKRDKKIFSFVIIDIDYFKLYNDTYGHLQGDEVLRTISNTLKSLLKRADDLCFRLGGEEFAIIFKSDNITNAKIFIENIKQEIEDIKIEHKKNSASPYVTISIGHLAVEPNMDISLDEVYTKADDLLYESKNNGRNKVTHNC